MAELLLKGQRALITGASSGIGKAIAEVFASAGAAVLINYASGRESSEKLVAEIEERGGQALAFQADVSVASDCARMFDAMRERFGGLDILVANAGIQRDAAFSEMTLDRWQEVIQLNLTGQFLCAQHAVREFRRQGLRAERSRALGKIIFTSSVH